MRSAKIPAMIFCEEMVRGCQTPVIAFRLWWVMTEELSVQPLVLTVSAMALSCRGAVILLQMPVACRRRLDPGAELRRFQTELMEKTVDRACFRRWRRLWLESRLVR